MKKTAEEIKAILTDLLNECLASGRQEQSLWKVAKRVDAPRKQRL